MKDAFQAILPISQAFARLWPRGGLKQPQQLANRLGGEGDASPHPKNYQEIMDKVSLKVVAGYRFYLLLIQFMYCLLCFRSNASPNVKIKEKHS